MRQGENLSRILFSLFPNDLEQYAVANSCLYFNIDFNTADVDFSKYVQLLLLLYADDKFSVGIKTEFAKNFARLS